MGAAHAAESPDVGPVVDGAREDRVPPAVSGDGGGAVDGKRAVCQADEKMRGQQQSGRLNPNLDHDFDLETIHENVILQTPRPIHI